MRCSRGVAIVALTALATGCAWRRTPVPIITDGQSVEALVGDWAGEYNSEDTHRRGTISFQLKTAKDTAFGDVLMTPVTQQAVNAVHENGAVPIAAVHAGEPLTIRFVRLGTGFVSGTLAPYRDPDCGCVLITTFSGKFTDPNTIEGSFQSKGSGFGHQPSAGKWKVTRQTSTRSDLPR